MCKLSEYYEYTAQGELTSQMPVIIKPMQRKIRRIATIVSKSGSIYSATRMTNPKM
jgi:hypothetical protein